MGKCDQFHSLLNDFYTLTLADGCYAQFGSDTVVYYDVFFRRIPDNGGFAIMAGLEQLVNYINNISYSEDELDFLKNSGISEKFVEYLRNFKFTGDIWAVPEGTPIFPGEPVVTLKGSPAELQLIETAVLQFINHQSLIATKANRIVRAAAGHGVIGAGARRSHGEDGARLGARAAYIGGCNGTSYAGSAMEFGIPPFDSMNHSWVQLFDNELDAFCAYAKRFPEKCVLLVDTYDTLRSGIPNAIEAFNRELVPNGYRPYAIRIDSGDLAYISRKARKMLDEAGFPDCEIIATNSLDEYIIRDMIMQGAKVDTYEVGERLITSASSPLFDGVYKLAAVEKDGNIVPKINISENVTKITTPGFKKVYRLFDRDTGKAIADLITLADEVIDENEPYELFDPDYTWKSKKISNFVASPLLKKIFDKGEVCYKCPSLPEIRDYCEAQMYTLWEEVLRFENPHKYYVDLSRKLWNEKQSIIEQMRSK
ncbi:MAG: nicotinate phosphoribosyltransferase [Clostridiales bacterium]|nr:nicotinate phosphoribosyltransferase [Clostridiales bacterium]